MREETHNVRTPYHRFPWTAALAVICLAAPFARPNRTFTAQASPSASATSGFTEGAWIAPEANTEGNKTLPLFRREFVAESKPRRATLRIAGLGDYDARVNGERLSETGINQPWSQYEKTIFYRDFDITRLVKRGENCVGVMLANSFWHNPNPPQGRYNKDGPQREAKEPLLLRAEVILEFKDGAVQKLGTDSTWKFAPGPITFSHIFAGEDYDAREQKKGWDLPGFDDAGWRPARKAAVPESALLPQTWPGFAELQTFEVSSVEEPQPGTFLYSFPQNCSAQLRLEVEGGKPGDRIHFRCGEHKKDQRLFGGYVVGMDLSTDGGRVAHQWISFYLGMQFVEVTGAVPKGHSNPKGLPVIRSMELVHVRTALPEVGTFSSSSDLLNRTHDLVDWAIRANTSHVLTDCPHREKLGWLECAYLLAPTFQYRYGCDEWFDKITRDIRDAQEPTGRVLTVAPSYPAGRFPGAFNWTVEWGAAAVLLPWHQYEWSGDPQVLRQNFDMMRRFTDYIQTESKDGLAPGGLGDWYDYGHGQPPGPSRFTPTELSATATWALCALTVSRAAEVLGQADDATKYRELHGRIARDFQRHFRNAETGKLKHMGSPQCANAMALCAEVVPASDREALVDEIIADLEKRDWQQTPGDVGHVYFIRALAQAGRSDVLHRVYSREGQGSYGGILKKGLTSMPETWDAMMDGYQSLNHCMLGHVMEWFYGYVAGIRQEPGTVGWKRVVIGPHAGALSQAQGSLKTPAGEILSRWRVKDGKFYLDVTLPPEVSGVAILPSGKKHALKPGKSRLSEEVRPEKGQ
jgi:hypothetical protein